MIFIISAISGGEQTDDSGKQNLMLVHAKHVDQDSPEIEFEVIDPKGNRRLTTEYLPQKWRKFAAPASSRGGSIVVIPKPIPGDWQLRIFWTDGLFRAAEFEVEIFCPSGAAAERAVRRVSLSPTQRYSEPVDFSIDSSR